MESDAGAWIAAGPITPAAPGPAAPGGAREPVGRVAVEPRTSYPRLLGLPTLGKGRPGEGEHDDSVQAVTCFAVRRGYRKPRRAR